MTKALYFDCFSGISGDMTLGALLDLGLDKEKVISEIGKLNIGGYQIKVNKMQKYAVSGTDVEVILTDSENATCAHDLHDLQNHHDLHDLQNHHDLHDLQNHHDLHGRQNHHDRHNSCERNLSDIKTIISNSGLSDRVKRLSVEIFTQIAEAEKNVHGKTLEQVYFHEVGAVDSIVDIVGVAICIDMLGIETFLCSELTEGRGFVDCRHGRVPVPVPAVLELLSESALTISVGDKTGELITPTGAAIVKTLAGRSQNIPSMNIEKIGYGFGKRDTGSLNAMRIVLGYLKTSAKTNSFPYDYDTVSEIQCNIDDMTGEELGSLMEHLLSCDALDVFYTPVHMKKSRPAFLLTVLALDEQKSMIIDEVLKHSSTLGVRMVQKERIKLFRETKQMNTPWGTLQIKVSYDSAMHIVKCKPEYQDCVRMAKENNITLKEILNWVALHK